jgi:hypothetical protein
MSRLQITHHTVRCPLDDCTAELSVRSDPGAAPSSRHREVVACSLRPSAPFVPLSREGYFADIAPPMSYHYEVGGTPCHAGKVTCGRRCLAVLNAAEAHVAESPLSTSGAGDALDVARLTQTPAMMRVLWSYSGG